MISKLKSLCIRNEVRSPEECGCGCHEIGQLGHNPPCCVMCQYCGKNIKFPFAFSHEAGHIVAERAISPFASRDPFLCISSAVGWKIKNPPMF